MIDLYEQLGVDKGASKEEIKMAYRKKAKKHHPDVGGDPKRFMSLTRAAKVLSDEEKRQRYDAGEDPETIESTTLQDEALSVLSDIFTAIIGDADVERDHLFHLVRDNILANIKKFRSDISKCDAQIKKLQSVIKRIKKTGPSENFFEASLTVQIRGIEANKKRLNHNIEIGELAAVILKEYDYEVEKVFPSPLGARMQMDVTFRTSRF